MFEQMQYNKALNLRNRMTEIDCMYLKNQELQTILETDDNY
jgi:hypothetical protein